MKKLDEINVFSVILCFAVILIHLTASPVTYMEEKFKITYTIIFAINKLLCFAVPGFLLLSGFKLHYKYKDEKVNLKKFYVGRFKKIYIPYLIANVLYFVFYLTKNIVLYDAKSIFSYLIYGTMVAHFYYIVIAMQFYLIFPFLIKFFKKYKKATLALSFIATVVFQQFISFYMSDRFFLSYILYFVIGMFVAEYYDKYKDKFLNKWFIILSFILWCGLAFYHVIYSYMSAVESFWYKEAPLINIFYVLAALICVYYVSVFTEKYLKGLKYIINSISKYSFYIYLYHIMAMHLLEFYVFGYFDLTIKEKFIYETIWLFGLVFTVPYLIEKKRKK